MGGCTFIHFFMHACMHAFICSVMSSFVHPAFLHHSINRSSFASISKVRYKLYVQWDVRVHAPGHHESLLKPSLGTGCVLKEQYRHLEHTVKFAPPNCCKKHDHCRSN